MIALVWLTSVAIFVATVVKHGWRSLPRWHRWYAVVAAPVALMFWLLVDRNLLGPMPDEVVAGLTVGWTVVVYFGLAIGVSQLLHLFERRPSSGAAARVQAVSAGGLPLAVECSSCKAPLSVTEESRGLTVQCSRCGTNQRLPP